MSKAPIRTLTVCSGRSVVGFINEIGKHNFLALHALTGAKVGMFATTADAAQAIGRFTPDQEIAGAAK
jgi:hypothetical protein